MLLLLGPRVNLPPGFTFPHGPQRFLCSYKGQPRGRRPGSGVKPVWEELGGCKGF